MKNTIALALMCLLAVACKDQPENLNGSDREKACNFATYSSQIAVQLSGFIPEHLVATVNGMPVVDECALGNDTASYTTVRTGNSVTIVLKVGKDQRMYDMFFDINGKPKNTQFQFSLRGSDECPAAGAPVIFQTTRNLEWQPVYPNSNATCTSGYRAVVTN